MTDAGTIEYNPNEGGEEVVNMLLKSAEAQDVPVVYQKEAKKGLWKQACWRSNISKLCRVSGHRTCRDARIAVLVTIVVGAGDLCGGEGAGFSIRIL